MATTAEDFVQNHGKLLTGALMTLKLRLITDGDRSAQVRQITASQLEEIEEALRGLDQLGVK
ncbi:hypothetical protein ABZ419_19515 [Streptomyces cinnamoneus]|uniref:hypothetical protein n=1 Tax=Streptomyces cinnamoneus TaxID=53446 RepID=UPI003411EA82